ncbi:unnamed protein product [Penicillium salamii]|uniref:3'-5' exonuclease domain-containing protein n=1 Tax=Penicillium salamii TaxID=1612424 RepID=A0A9W4JIL4_9EURO|nr:unnamed protein product [Penicillium salamii]CAG8235880.1 unnamed protein product [Penicillium salamii]CAG8323518.1 unnamed protein product [Penicillium salamii]CAG8364010.1 unnamed protein product [Penicillium salamii]CAG8387892.1 unnamed protein product [Penicillium salamii]
MVLTSKATTAYPLAQPEDREPKQKNELYHTVPKASEAVGPHVSASLMALKKNDSINLVDTCAGVVELIESFANLPVTPPSLYVDLEGINLSRYGTISILQIFVLPKQSTFLIDIHKLRHNAFSYSAPNGITLRHVLESPSIPKVFFDVRNDSDALFSHYQIKLSGVHDLQLMELATRSFSRRCVSGLSKCLEKDLPMTASERAKWKYVKDKGRRLFAPECGGSYEVFNTRPLPDEIRQYCAGDVQLLPELWRNYNSKITPRWAARVESEVKNRVWLSQSATFNGKGRHMALAPAHWA